MSKGSRKLQNRHTSDVQSTGSRSSEIKIQIEKAGPNGSGSNQQGNNRSSSSQLVNGVCDGERGSIVLADEIANRGNMRVSDTRPDVVPGDGGSGRNVKVVRGKTVEADVPWVESVSENRCPSKSLQLRYTPPMMVGGVAEAEIKPEDTKGETEYWENSLILFTAGKDMSMNAIKQFMGKVWRFVSMPELVYHDDGYFIARFSKAADREAVLARAPYTIFSVPLFMRKWSKGFVKTDEMIRLMPIWVTFPGLPLHLWGAESLSKISSILGVPLATDECTTRKLRISYARVLIEMDITWKAPKQVRIKDEDGTILLQKVEYEWLPDYCEKCHMLGHDCATKKKPIEKKHVDIGLKRNEVWMPKEAVRSCNLQDEKSSGKAAMPTVVDPSKSSSQVISVASLFPNLGKELKEQEDSTSDDNRVAGPSEKVVPDIHSSETFPSLGDAPNRPQRAAAQAGYTRIQQIAKDQKNKKKGGKKISENIDS